MHIAQYLFLVCSCSVFLCKVTRFFVQFLFGLAALATGIGKSSVKTAAVVLCISTFQTILCEMVINWAFHSLLRTTCECGIGAVFVQTH